MYEHVHEVYKEDLSNLSLIVSQRVEGLTVVREVIYDHTIQAL